MKKILIIEDDNVIRENISELFEEENFLVLRAKDGMSGIKIAIESVPDIILCDILMPEMDGFEVKKKLSENEITSAIPFIYLTAKIDIQDVQHAMELGADDYIVKPIELDKLLKLINNRLKRINELNRDAYSLNNKKNKLISGDEKILLKCGNEHLLTSLGEIIIIKSLGDYSEITLVNSKKSVLKRSLKSWEERLPEKTFLRIHRAIIINIKYIEKIDPWFKGTYVAKLHNYPEPIYFSLRYSQKIRKLLSL